MLSYPGRDRKIRIVYTCQRCKRGKESNVRDVNVIYYEKYV